MIFSLIIFRAFFLIIFFLLCFADKTHFFVGSEFLRENPDFPIIFHTLKGNQQRHNTSYYNTDEKNYIVSIIDKLLLTPGLRTCDIGVVSPYDKQVQILSQTFVQRGWNDITVGSAETFQGQERLAMIVSTVRSDGNLGFLGNYRVSLWNWKHLTIFLEYSAIFSYHNCPNDISNRNLHAELQLFRN